LGAEGSTNATGDVVKKLDVIANEAFITQLKRSQNPNDRNYFLAQQRNGGLH